MKLDNKQLYNLLSEMEVTELNHANTIATSITFIKEGGILSRGAVEERGLIQTPQSSDEIDKIFGVWNDIFVDTVDLHKYFNRQNYYGPLLFKFSTEFLNIEKYEVWITKQNPIEWKKNMTNEEKYFTSVDELKSDWSKYQRQKKMITIRNIKEPILFKYLNQVVVDDPYVKNNDLVYFNESIKALKFAVSNNTILKNKFITRECSGCFCRSNYLNQVSNNDLNRLFLT